MISEYFVENFQELYHSNYSSIPLQMEEVGEKFIMESENERITRTPFEENIKAAVLEFTSLKESRSEWILWIFFLEILDNCQEQIHQLCSRGVSAGLYSF